MATRRKTPARAARTRAGVAKRRSRRETESSAPTAQAFTVVLEDLRSQFKVFGEALTGLRQEMTGEFAAVRGEMKAEFAAVRGEMAAGFDAVDRRFVRVERDLGLVKTAVVEHGRELREVRGAVTRIEGALDRKVDREELEDVVARAIAKG